MRQYGKVITTTATDGETLYAKFDECVVIWVEDANEACHFLRQSDADQMAFGEDCMAIIDHCPTD